MVMVITETIERYECRMCGETYRTREEAERCEEACELLSLNYEGKYAMRNTQFGQWLYAIGKLKEGNRRIYCAKAYLVSNGYVSVDNNTVFAVSLLSEPNCKIILKEKFDCWIRDIFMPAFKRMME